MNQFADRKPRGNIFNIFDKGKDFFLLRTVITLITMIALIIGCIKLAERAWSVYPVVIRDSYGNVSMGEGRTYRETPQEIVRIVTSVAESMFTQTEEGVAEDVLAPYLAPDILRSLKAQRGPRAGYISTGYTSDFFFGDIDNKRGLRVVFLQLELISASDRNIMVDNAYLNFVIRKGPKTVDNPSGWRIIRMSPISMANYYESRRQYVKDELSVINPLAEINDVSDTIKE